MADPINSTASTTTDTSTSLTHLDDPQIREDISDISVIPETGSTWDYDGHCEYVAPALGLEPRQPHEATDYGTVGNAAATVGNGLAWVGKHLWADPWYYATSKAISGGTTVLTAPSEAGLNAVGVSTDTWYGNIASKVGMGLEVAGISTGLTYAFNRNTPLSGIAEKLGYTDKGAALAQKMGAAPETPLKSLPTGKAGLTGQLTGHWWRTEGWKFGAMVALGQFRFFSNAGAFYDAVPDVVPGGYTLDGNTFRQAVGPQYADNGLYTAMTAAGLGMAAAAYRSVVMNDPDFKVANPDKKPGLFARATGQGQMSPIPAKGTPVMPFLTSLGISAAYVGQSWYTTQVSTQQRVEHDLYPGEDLAWGGAYNPVNWDSRFVQQHSTASMTFNWGVLAPVWAALGPYTTKVSDLYAKHLVAPVSQTMTNFDVRKTLSSTGALMAGFEDKATKIPYPKVALPSWDLIKSGKIREAFKSIKLSAGSWEPRPIQASIDKLAPLAQSPVAQGAATLVNKPIEYLGRFAKYFSYTSTDVSQEVASEPFKNFVEKGVWAPRDPNAPRAAWIRFLEAEAQKISGKKIAMPRFSTVGEAITKKMPQRARSVLARVGYGKKVPVTFNQIAWSIPIAIGISQFRMKSQGFDTKDSINGSANGLWTSSMMSQVSSSYFVSSKGFVTNWDYYFLNMFVQNNTVTACTQQSEMIYQPAEKALADYRAAEAAGNPLEQEKALLLMAYAYKSSSGPEREKVKVLFTGADPSQCEAGSHEVKCNMGFRTGIGIDPDALLAEIDALGAEMQ